MTSATFDTLTAARDLEAAGIERDDERTATKADLDTAIASVRPEFGTIRWVAGIQPAITLATFVIVAAKLL